MPLPVVCPSCQLKFAVPERFAGKRGKCPSCGSVFRAPAAESVLVAAQASQAAVPPAPPEDDIPVGIPVEDAPPIETPVEPAPPPMELSAGQPEVNIDLHVVRPAPRIQRGPAPEMLPVASRRGWFPISTQSRTSPLLLGSIAVGIVLLCGAIGLSVWAVNSGTFSKPVAGASKPAKKPPKKPADREQSEPVDSTEEPTDPVRPTGPKATEEPDKESPDLGPPPVFEKPEPVIPPPVVVPPPPAVDALSVESIEKLAEEGGKMNWKPADAEDFKKLQILARLVAQATVAADGAAAVPEEQAKLAAAGQKVIQTLSETSWATDAKLAEVNRLSAASLMSDEAGVYAYATARGMTEGDRRLLLLELDGTTEMLAVPVKTTKLETPEGSRWLVLGYRVGQLVQIDIRGNGTNRTIRPPIVNVTHLIGEPGNE